MIVQGSDEWLAMRCGKVTASRVKDVIAKTKTGYSASRETYMGELIAERLTGTPAEKFQSAAMRFGTENEGAARLAYEFHTGSDVFQVPFVLHPVIANSGASPDGLIAGDGLVEFKCPNTSTHIETLLSEKVPGAYVTQMQWQMACTERAWCDFVSFDPRLPEDMRLFVKRIERDDKAIADMESEVVKFLGELAEKVDQLTAKFRKEAA